jgi:hypothetical protein
MQTAIRQKATLRSNHAFRLASLLAFLSLLLVAPAQGKPRSPIPLLPEDSLLRCFRFNDTNSWAGVSPVPLNFHNVLVRESWSGYSVYMSARQSSLLQYRLVETEGHSARFNLNPARGAVRMWVCPDWSSASLGGTGPGARARLLEVGDCARGVAGSWMLAFSPDGNSIALSAYPGGNALDSLQANIKWECDAWHLVALNYGPERSQLFVDGELAAEGTGVLSWTDPALASVQSFCVGGDPLANNCAEAQLEDCTTFNVRQFTPSEVADYYRRTISTVALGPVTPEEEAATFSATAKFALQNHSAEASVPASSYCGLWLEIQPAPNSEVTLILHNTVDGRAYRILQRSDLLSTSWAVEKTVAGAAGQDYTITTVAMAGRPNLYLMAIEGGPYELDMSFRGLDDFDTRRSVPDTMGAVGQNHFVELLNGKVAIFSKADGGRLEEKTMEDFFAVQVGEVSYPTGQMADPRLLYDHHSQRWVACALDLHGSQQLILAVSEGSNPSGLLTTWRKYLVPIARAGSSSDFDTLGIDANGLYMSVMHFHYEPGAVYHYDGNTVVAVKKTNILQGSFQPTLLFQPPEALNTTAIQPAVNFDAQPLNAYAWFVAKGPPHSDPPYAPGEVLYRRLQWNGDLAEWVDSSWTTLTPSSYTSYYDLDSGTVSAPQLGGPVRIDLAVGSRLMMAIIRDGFLWTCQQVGLDGVDGDYDGNGTGSTVDRTGVQWLKCQINSSGEPLTLSDHGRIFDCSGQPYFYYFPSLMANSAGDMVVGYSASSETKYIGAYYTWRLADGTSHTQPGLIHAGVDYYGDFRWGDYSYTSLDPDGVTFWTVQEFADGPSFGSPIWATWIARIAPVP